VSGAGAIGLGKPILCNGANLAFEKSVFTDLINPMNQDIASGDDIFLMLSIKKKYPEKVKFLKSKQAIVYTKGQINIREFINQRIRWTSKSKNYSDFDIIFVSLVVFFANFSVLTILVLTSCGISSFLEFSILFFFKLLPDYLLLKRASKYFNIKNLNLLFFPTQFLYIWYVVFIAIFGNILNFSWKNRRY